MYTQTPYATLADAIVALDPNMLPGSSDGAWLEDLLLQAQADIDREVGYPFQTDGTIASPTTRYFDGEDKESLWIDTCLYITGPTGGIFEIQTDSVLGGDGIWLPGTTTTFDITADCVLKPNNVSPQYMLRRKSGLPFDEGLQNYSVTGVWGWPPMPGSAPLLGQKYASVPGDITRATVRLAIHYYKMRDTNYSDMLMDGNIREKYTKEWPLDVVQIVERYKRRMFVARSL